jgi:flagellar biogenesis protein FliO
MPGELPSPIEEMSYWSLYIIIFFTFSQLLLLGFVVSLAYRLEKLMRQVQELSQDAGKFLRMGMQFFKTQK